MDAYEHAPEGFGCGGIDMIDCAECGESIPDSLAVYWDDKSVCETCRDELLKEVRESDSRWIG